MSRRKSSIAFNKKSLSPKKKTPSKNLDGSSNILNNHGGVVRFHVPIANLPDAGYLRVLVERSVGSENKKRESDVLCWVSIQKWKSVLQSRNMNVDFDFYSSSLLYTCFIGIVAYLLCLKYPNMSFFNVYTYIFGTSFYHTLFTTLII